MSHGLRLSGFMDCTPCTNRFGPFPDLEPIKTEVLFTVDGEPGLSKGQGQ